MLKNKNKNKDKKSPLKTGLSCIQLLVLEKPAASEVQSVARMMLTVTENQKETVWSDRFLLPLPGFQSSSGAPCWRSLMEQRAKQKGG